MSKSDSAGNDQGFPDPCSPGFFATWLSRTSWQTKQPNNPSATSFWGLTAFARRGRARRGSVWGLGDHSMLLVVFGEGEQATMWITFLAPLLHRSLPGEAVNVCSKRTRLRWGGRFCSSRGPPSSGERFATRLWPRGLAIVVMGLPRPRGWLVCRRIRGYRQCRLLPGMELPSSSPNPRTAGNATVTRAKR